jgi:hypothetical protein
VAHPAGPQDWAAICHGDGARSAEPVGRHQPRGTCPATSNHAPALSPLLHGTQPDRSGQHRTIERSRRPCDRGWLAAISAHQGVAPPGIPGRFSLRVRRIYASATNAPSPTAGWSCPGGTRAGLRLTDQPRNQAEGCDLNAIAAHPPRNRGNSALQHPEKMDGLRLPSAVASSKRPAAEHSPDGNGPHHSPSARAADLMRLVRERSSSCERTATYPSPSSAVSA